MDQSRQKESVNTFLIAGLFVRIVFKESRRNSMLLIRSFEPFRTEQAGESLFFQLVFLIMVSYFPASVKLNTERRTERGEARDRSLPESRDRSRAGPDRPTPAPRSGQSRRSAILQKHAPPANRERYFSVRVTASVVTVWPRLSVTSQQSCRPFVAATAVKV